MDIFNAPARETCTVRRERTNTPLQALVTLNDPQFVEAARRLAELGGRIDSRRARWTPQRVLWPARPADGAAAGGLEEVRSGARRLTGQSLTRTTEPHAGRCEEADLAVGESKHEPRVTIVAARRAGGLDDAGQPADELWTRCSTTMNRNNASATAAAFFARGAQIGARSGVGRAGRRRKSGARRRNRAAASCRTFAPKAKHVDLPAHGRRRRRRWTCSTTSRRWTSGTTRTCPTRSARASG